MELSKMRILDLWHRQQKRLPAVPAVSAALLKTAIAVPKKPGPASTLSRARAADTDGRARRRKQLVESNRLL
jgi:hypothetical protein